MDTLKTHIHQLVDRLISKEMSFDERFFLKTLGLSMLVSFVASIFNIVLRLDQSLILLTAITFITFAVMFWAARFKRFFKAIRFSFLVVTIIILNALWLLNAGSKGPTLLIFQALFALGLFITPGRFYIPIAVIFGLNVTLLFGLEFYYPELIIPYSNPASRLTDIYVITVIFFLCEIPLIYYAHNSFKAEKTRAQESDKMKTSFLANMSHEIRTPMNAILGFSELLRDDDITRKEKNQYLDIIKENGNVLLDLLGNILNLSKLEADLMEKKEGPVQVYPFMEQMKFTFEKQVDPDKVRLVTEYPMGYKDIFIYSDELILYQVFSNLLNNAIKFTTRGQITIGFFIDETQPSITFFVRDTGLGITPEKVSLIFERFRQGDETLQRNHQGVGLGLTISKGLMAVLNGTMWVESKINKGSTFYFCQPLKKVEVPQIALKSPGMN